MLLIATKQLQKKKKSMKKLHVTANTKEKMDIEKKIRDLSNVQCDVYKICSNCSWLRREAECRNANCQNEAEVWPLYMSLHGYGYKTFDDYNPSNIVLCSLLQSYSKANIPLEELFTRFTIQLNEIKREPIRVRGDDCEWLVKIELYSCAIDFDGFYDGKMTYVTNGTERKYSFYNMPKDHKRISIPHTFEHSYDFLHLMSEGVSKDRLRDFTNKEKSNIPNLVLTQSELTKIFLQTVMVTDKPPITPQGLENHAKLTGREIDELMNVTVPLVGVLFDKPAKDSLFALIIWIITRFLMDMNAYKNDIKTLKELGIDLNELGKNGYRRCFTMKLHVAVVENMKRLKMEKMRNDNANADESIAVPSDNDDYFEKIQILLRCNSISVHELGQNLAAGLSNKSLDEIKIQELKSIASRSWSDIDIQRLFSESSSSSSPIHVNMGMAFMYLNLNQMYPDFVIKGADLYSRVRSLMKNILVKLTSPPPMIWLYTHSPNKASDSVFSPLPDDIVTTNIEFTCDCLDVYLPQEFDTAHFADIDKSAPFFVELGANDEARINEIRRRREVRLSIRRKLHESLTTTL
ncbi:unnamed protein product [Caenorhabditis bovis]|uniref:Uncharacterized protein n=1 Tax=Caenorhabditis bovis TaxID=2654633 RepID=A0A8S1FB38_9PELO|nr:unnamed protein product [Caenorhabditis bovis]